MGVIGSLIFVGLEIRANTVAARAAAYQQTGSAISNIWLEIGQDPARSLLTLEVFENRERVLTPAEEAQLTTQPSPPCGSTRSFGGR